MKYHGLNELREMFLSFFESKGHLRLPSFSLVPHSDKSLLLINSGMAPMKPWFTGEQEPPSRRIATCQKCIRTGDIENIGKTSRHGTYFEMLGNFSFGDYFKSESLKWTWEFLTEVVEIDGDKLWPSVYEEDDETFDIWVNEIGLSPDRITRLGKEDNFWEHGAGPCGPCSEVYFDRGAEFGCSSLTCGPGCECDRFIEVWNNVFTQFENDGNNNYTELKQKNIDTGMGLERLAVVCQGVDSIFDVDTLMNITDHISRVTGAKYGQDKKTDVSLRIITDHLRSSVMMISDGILPTNEGRGYVLRRLLRRAARHGRLLGVKDAFLHQVCLTVIEENEGAYPELRERVDHITRIVRTEEDNFNKTLDGGMEILVSIFSDVEKKGGKAISGDNAFRLYDTYGFPVELTVEMAEERGFDVDRDKFDELMLLQRKRARDARAAMGDLAWEGIDFGDDTRETVFKGYDSLFLEAKITAVVIDEEVVSVISQGQKGIIVLDATPFYPEMGGQSADHGKITFEDSVFKVTDVQKTKGNKYLHYGTMEKGDMKTGTGVFAVVDSSRRRAIMRAHSATHLLQYALGQVLGDHVMQSGSLVMADRLRFDFTHYEAMTAEQVLQVENLVNTMVLEGQSVDVMEMSLEDAKKIGATALFGEKYGDVVRIVKMGDGSIEFCGGTHLENTSLVGMFRIDSEASVASGVRRIEGATGFHSLRQSENERSLIGEIRSSLKANTAEEIKPRIEQMKQELRDLKQIAASTAAKKAGGEADELFASAQEIGAVKVIASKVDAADVKALRTIGDSLRDKDPSVTAVLAGEFDGKVTFLAVCGKNAVAAGVKAGEIIKHVSAIAGGSGGGKPDSAMGGGKDPTKIPDALNAVFDFVKSKI